MVLVRRGEDTAPYLLVHSHNANLKGLKTIDEQARPVLARGVRLQKDAKTGEPVLLFPEGVLYLSATAHEIVKLCDGQTTAAGIIASLAQEYDAGQETLRTDVLECLGDLRQRKVLSF